MTALLGGLVALILGIIGIIFWWGYFQGTWQASRDVNPRSALATYLRLEEMKDKGI
jgi:hypothetical protein